MDVGIVGAGIAGLAAAIGLRRAGHNVEIFEKSNFKREIGAAILLTPNGNRVIRRWGFDFHKARPVDFKQFRFVRVETLQIALRTSFEDVEERFGERMCAYHRVDLHSGLREVAEKVGVKIRLGAEVVEVWPEEGEVELRGGEKVKKDFWVLADGCHTGFVSKIAQEHIPSVKIGKSVYRWLAPFDKVIEHPGAAILWNNEGAGFCTFFNEKGVTMVTYPCRGGELLNCAVFHDTRPEERDKEDWDSDTTHEKVLEAMEGFHEAVRNIPMTADQMKVYTVTQRPPSTRIYRGKMLCIGDATHHMLPTHAQGACSALEDAGALEILFAASNFTYSPANLEKRLNLYQQLRLPRSATTQILSSTNPRFTMEGLAKKTDEIRKFYQGELVDWPMGVTSWSEPIRDFFYGYDVFKEAEKAMEYAEVGALPQGWKWFGDVKERGRMEWAMKT